MSDRLENIPVELLMPAFVLLRLVDKTSLDYIEMRDSIMAHGFFSAICVRESKRQEGRYEIIEGVHRYCCALDCGFKEVPCIIKEATDADVKNWQMQANLIRKSTTNSEYAARLKMLFADNPELTMETLAMELHCHPGKIKDILKLNNLIPVAKKHLDVGDLPLTSAYALSKLPKQLQEDLIKDALASSVREFVQLCNGYSKSYREAVMEGRFKDYLQSLEAPMPHLRSFSAIRQEYTHPVQGEFSLENLKNKEPIEIWIEALAWVLHLDQASIQKAKERAQKRVDITQRKLLRHTQTRRNRCIGRKLGIDPNDTDMIEIFT
jgi:ParB/RepB/Spo0J family partition protein